MDERGFAPREGGPFLKSNRSTQARSRGPTWRDRLHISPTLLESLCTFFCSSTHLSPIVIFVINSHLSVVRNYLKLKFAELQAFMSLRMIDLI